MVSLQYIISLPHYLKFKEGRWRESVGVHLVISNVRNWNILENVLVCLQKTIKKTKTNKQRLNNKENVSEEREAGRLHPHSRQNIASMSWRVTIFVFTSIFSVWFGHRFKLVKLSTKMSLLKQKLFKWKEKQKIPKTEWPELVGKVALNKLLLFVSNHGNRRRSEICTLHPGKFISRLMWSHFFQRMRNI